MATNYRWQNIQQHRGAYITPGPNFFSSIDGYLKLAPYGIEIYAALNAYFWYIIWINGYQLPQSCKRSLTVLGDPEGYSTSVLLCMARPELRSSPTF